MLKGMVHTEMSPLMCSCCSSAWLWLFRLSVAIHGVRRDEGKLSTHTLPICFKGLCCREDLPTVTMCTAQIFSAATLRELDASAYEEAPPLSREEIAEELGRASESGARPGSSSRSLGGQRRSLGRHASKLRGFVHLKQPMQCC